MMTEAEVLDLEPIAPHLFRIDNGVPVLIGGRDKETGRIVFPMPEGAEAQRFEEVQLKREGKLWSWTVQRFRPKTPPYRGPGDDRNFEPFPIGYVELDGQVIVETRIDADENAHFEIGMPMELVLAPFELGDEERFVSVYAFRPKA